MSRPQEDDPQSRIAELERLVAERDHAIEALQLAFQAETQRTAQALADEQHARAAAERAAAAAKAEADDAKRALAEARREIARGARARPLLEETLQLIGGAGGGQSRRGTGAAAAAAGGGAATAAGGSGGRSGGFLRGVGGRNSFWSAPVPDQRRREALERLAAQVAGRAANRPPPRVRRPPEDEDGAEAPVPRPQRQRRSAVTVPPVQEVDEEAIALDGTGRF
jgi:hypothetical protein